MNRAHYALFFLLLSGLVAGTATGATNPSRAAEARSELKELRARIEALQKKLQDAEGTRAEAADALKTSERAISDASRRLRELAEESEELNKRLDEIRSATRQREAALKRQQALIEDVFYQQYIAGRNEPLRLMLSGEDPNRIARNLYYLAQIARARADAIEAVRNNLSHLRALWDEAQTKAAQLASLTAEQAGEKQRLEKEKRARGELLARISRDLRKQQDEIGTLKRNETRLARLVEQLSRIVTRKPSSPPVRNERVPDGTLSGAFESLKGRLRLPVRGELRNRFGSPRPEGGVTGKGLFIAARSGDEVRAIAGGRVVFADWLRGFGNLLIIDHGGAYMSLYGYNESLYKRVGDAIRGGDPIAAVGNSGGNAVSGLYFELRHEGRPLDPLPWVENQ